MRRALLLSGGGLKTLSLCGALECLDLSEIKFFGGVSAGSLLALVYSMGLGTGGVVAMLGSVPYRELFMEHLSIPGLLYRGSAIEVEHAREMVQCLARGCGLPLATTFREHFLRTGKLLRIFACSLSRQMLCAFDATSHPHLEIVRCLCASIAIPFLFEPVRIEGELYVDAGIFSNAPMNMMGPCEELIVLSVTIPAISVDTFAARVAGSVDIRTNFIQRAAAVYASRAFVVRMPTPKGAAMFKVSNVAHATCEGRTALLIRVAIFEIIGLFVFVMGVEELSNGEFIGGRREDLAAEAPRIDSEPTTDPTTDANRSGYCPSSSSSASFERGGSSTSSPSSPAWPSWPWAADANST